MAIVAGGIVSLKPVGGVVSNNPHMTDAQTQAAQQEAARKEAERQQKVDNLINKFSETNNPNQKKWSVPFK